LADFSPSHEHAVPERVAKEYRHKDPIKTDKEKCIVVVYRKIQTLNCGRLFFDC